MEKKNIVIFGDSYSTFDGYIPQGYGAYYSASEDSVTDVRVVENTWWHRFISATNGNLLLNDSWSGSTVCYTAYNNRDCSGDSSFIYRFKKLQKDGFFKKNRVDRVLVFGGTNDNWADAPIGELQFSDWTKEDLFNVAPAFCYFAYLLRQELPNAEIIFLINTELKTELVETIEKAAVHYGAKALILKDIDKACGHPTIAGMRSIHEQLLAFLQE